MRSTKSRLPVDVDWARPTLREILRGERLLHVGVTASVQSSSSALVRSHDLADMTVEQLLDVIEAGRDDNTRRAPNGEDFHVRIAASTETLSRDNGIIPVSAWERHLSKFFPDNPVLLFAHWPFEPPIGRAVDLELKTGRNARMLQWWLFNDVTRLSQDVHALYEIGDMRAASVGFMLRAWHRADEAELKKLSKKFPDINEFTWIADEAELVETSAVPTPSDFKALVEGRSTDDDLDRLYAELGERYADGREQRGDRPVQVFLGTVSLASKRGLDLDVLRRSYLEALERQCAEGDEKACACLETECSCVEPHGAAGATTDNKTTVANLEVEIEVRIKDEDERGAIPFSAHGSSYAVAPKDATWDAGKERKAMAASRTSLRPRHAFITDAADAAAKGSYKFPHHRAASNKAVVFRALAQGFARLGQASISDAAKDGVAAHLGRHYRTDFDLEPPERAVVADVVARLSELDVDTGFEEPMNLTEAGREITTLAALGGGDLDLGLEVAIIAADERSNEIILELDDDPAEECVVELIDEPADNGRVT